MGDLSNEVQRILKNWDGNSWDGFAVEDYLAIQDFLRETGWSSTKYFLKSLGYLNDNFGQKIAFDRRCYYKMKREYHIELYVIANWFGIVLNTASSRAWQNRSVWSGKKLNEVEKYLLQKMIQNQEVEYMDGYLSIRIFNNDKHETMIFIIDGLEVKMVENDEIDEAILAAIKEQHLNRILTRNPGKYHSDFYEFYEQIYKIADSENNVDFSLDTALESDIIDFFSRRKVPKKHLDINIDYFVKRLSDNKLSVVSSTKRREDLLQTILEIDGSMRKSKKEGINQERSVKLATKLKEYYGFTCQLCDCSSVDGMVPQIPHKDENHKYYVEVHHLIPIGDKDYSHKEDANLDAAWNAIVVCCYHHKVLHFHRDLYDDKVTYDSKQDCFFIASKRGSKMRVVLDKHFRALRTLNTP